ncbi:unnamed protein product, partial [Cyprideis torosa]
ERATKRSEDSVLLLAVSKKHPADAIREAIACGQRDFGENYAQELAQKCEDIGQDAAIWHFIGPLQSNKTAIVAKHAHWCHSVDRLKIAKRLSEQRPDGMPDLQVCIEVNIDEEESKSGVMPAEVEALAKEISKLPHLTLRGLMCIPLASADPTRQRASFAHLQQLQHDLIRKGFELDTLSMGMSADYHEAISQGSTIVRIGTAIFGARQ